MLLFAAIAITNATTTVTVIATTTTAFAIVVSTTIAGASTIPITIAFAATIDLSIVTIIALTPFFTTVMFTTLILVNLSVITITCTVTMASTICTIRVTCHCSFLGFFLLPLLPLLLSLPLQLLLEGSWELARNCRRHNAAVAPAATIHSFHFVTSMFFSSFIY